MGFTLVELLVVIGIIGLLISILMPALSKARESAKTTQCISNLRQMAIAAQMYANENHGFFPIASYSVSNGNTAYGFNWDFTTVLDLITGKRTVIPGLLWNGKLGNDGSGAVSRIQQCPSFDGKSNTLLDPYTGYNYNTSYVGGEQIAATGALIAPAKASQIRRAWQTAIFGDGQYSAGADKYMRSPARGPRDAAGGFGVGGTQGFRHRGKTNVAFVDGHAETLSDRFTAGLPVAIGTGFISPDNSLYGAQ
jgi:prepilin-type processing-associated H-X9-DG protein/prepilin-type N-terminal cleavage/methylation domain-containing protein